ncbi:MAG: HD-GYP domain-containing protein [Bdellovibrionales bacterium]
MNALVEQFANMSGPPKTEPDTQPSVAPAPQKEPTPIDIITGYYQLTETDPLTQKLSGDAVQYNQVWEAHTLNIHDTINHEESTAAIALQLADEFPRITPQERSMLYVAALYHDIGKFDLPPETVFVERDYTDTEYKLVQTHAAKSEEIIKNFKINDFNNMIRKHNKEHPENQLVLLPDDKAIVLEIATLAGQHHEDCNGTGYPRRLPQGDQSLLSDILTAADVYDALTSKRVYRQKPYSPAVALHMMHYDEPGKFNPKVLEKLDDLMLGPTSPVRPSVHRHQLVAPLPSPMPH